jgi:hypothetical protein
MCVTDEEREILDNADPEAVRQAFTDLFRENDGERLRALLKRCAPTKSLMLRSFTRSSFTIRRYAI